MRPPQGASALVGLGANLGDAAATLRAALDDLGRLPGCRLLRVSGLWSSSPVDAGGPDYCNAVAELASSLAPLALLRAMQDIEDRHGRVRPAGVRNAPRTLDLDMLCFGDVRLEHARLILPHPRMHLRAFVLAPLAEIRPDWRLADGEPIDAAVRRLLDAGQQVRRVGALDPL